MSNLQHTIEEAFRTAGLRATAQRYAVLEHLARTPVHATAEEILAAINRRDPRASRATVYNSLRSLEKAGLVREVLTAGQAARFDANLHRHHHFVCDVCGAVEDVPWFEIPAAAQAVTGGRKIHSYEILFRGACTRCRKEAKG